MYAGWYFKSHYLLWPICFGLIRRWVATLAFSVISFHKAKNFKQNKTKQSCCSAHQKPHRWMAAQVGIKHSTGSWRPAPSAERVPSWSDHRAGSSPKLQTSWSTRRAPLHGAWCKGCRWSSWSCGMVRECRIKGSGYAESKWGEKTERTGMLLSCGLNKEALSLECRWLHSRHRRHLVVCHFGDKLVDLHILLCTVCSWVLGCVDVSLCVRGSVCSLRITEVSMECEAYWCACLEWEPRFDGAEDNFLRNVENQLGFSYKW